MMRLPTTAPRGPRQRSTRVGLALFLPLLVTVLPAGLHPAPVALSIEDRVRAQEAIERVYYSHQIGAIRPFEQAVSRQVLENKVRTYLKQSVALERFWNTPVTAAMLRAEAERMIRQTRMPGRQREIFEALGNDSVLIQECLARPALVGRLTRSFFAYDEAIHARAKREAEAVHAGLLSGRIDPHGEHINRTLKRREERGQDDAGRGGAPAGAPARPGEIGPLLDQRERYATHVVLRKEAGADWVASYIFPKRSWEEWWEEVESHLDENLVEAVASPSDAIPRPREDPDGGTVSEGFSQRSMSTTGAPPVSACVSEDSWLDGSFDDYPDQRHGHTAVWTGSVMVIWGGAFSIQFANSEVFFNTGRRYDPAIDTWTAVSTTSAPEGRSGHTAVWTGSRMVVWGGRGASGDLAAGGRYDPTTDTWQPMAALGASRRSGHTAVWTGRVMIVWGGTLETNSGGRYDPETDTWAGTSTVNAPAPRDQHTAAWTGSRMVIWGGRGAGSGEASFLATGGRYDPVSDTWEATATTNAPLRRYGHTAAWTGSRMIVWGGQSQFVYLDSGGSYDPAADTWAPTSRTGAPSGRTEHAAVWTGDLMLIWGGWPNPSGGLSYYVTTGGRYDPQSDTWMPTATINAPAGRDDWSVVWTGQHMIIWGGRAGGAAGGYYDTGGRYDPLTDIWTPTSPGDAPAARRGHSAIWTGSLMVVWGGVAFDPDIGSDRFHSSGGRYDPVTDSWTPTSTANAPAARMLHSAVWTGHEMIVWGGLSDDPLYLNSGGRYDPAADAWTPTSLTGAPEARYLHTTVWTGSKMIVWGGGTSGGSRTFGTGGLYDPSTDSWALVSEANAPSARWGHTAAWTGSLMIVWGGGSGDGLSVTGGRYDPIGDSWTPASILGAPSPRWLHTSVWTGREMIVWGGSDGNNLASGGRYDPATDNWRPTSLVDVPAARNGHTSVWNDGVMIVWGGRDASNSQAPLVNTGGRYDPENDTWTPTTIGNAPTGRVQHTAAWTGEVMIIWGGDHGQETRTGGIYCACPTEIFYLDADGDGRGTAETWLRSCSRPAGYVTDGSDCNDGAADVWAPPGEARDLLFVDDQTLAWTAPVDPGATSIVYDLIRSSDSSDFVSQAICIGSDVIAETVADNSAPPPGQVISYLVRAENACPGGQGSLGTDSEGVPRAARSCP